MLQTPKAGLGRLAGHFPAGMGAQTPWPGGPHCGTYTMVVVLFSITIQLDMFMLYPFTLTHVKQLSMHMKGV